jgi:hypothetical protein
MGQMNRLDPHSVKTSSDRSFGLIFAIVFGVIAVWPLLNGFPLRSWATWLSFAFVMIALIAPTRLAPLNRRWTQFGLFLHKIVNPIILGLIFILTIIPIGFIIRVLGKDSLRLRRDLKATSYWIERKPSGPPPDSFPHQF